MFTCKIKVGAEWELAPHPVRIDKCKTYPKGRKMTDIKAIKEILKSLKGQYKNISQEEDGEYIIIKAR